MPRFLATAPLFLLFALVGAPAPCAPLDAAFGNTIVSTYPNGLSVLLWLRPGGDYAAEGRWGARSSGRWIQKDAQLCLKQARPFPSPFSYCTQIPAGDVHAAWTARAVTGEVVRVRLVQGVRDQHPPALR